MSRIDRYLKIWTFFWLYFQQIVNGQVGPFRNHVAKVVVVEHCLEQGIKTTLVHYVLVLGSITKIATPTVVQVSVDTFHFYALLCQGK